MNLEFAERWERISALVGTAAWTTLAGLAGRGRAPLGVVELLFLFAPLVIVPLGLALSRNVAPLRSRFLGDSIRLLQPFAAALVVASFWQTPGQIAGVLVAPWLLLCGALGLAGFWTLLRGKQLSLTSWAVNIGRIDLAVAGTWLLISRLGLCPLSIQEPIVLLTGVHFHYTGFATALIAGTLIASVRRSSRISGLLSATVTLVLGLPFLVAAGFVWSPTLKLVAVLALSLSMSVFAGLQFWHAGALNIRPARCFLRTSASAVIFGMALAVIYGIGDWLKQDWLLIPRMASTHGLLNGLGFVLLGLLGWLIAIPLNTSQDY